MKPRARKPVAALTGVAAVAALASMAVQPPGAAHAPAASARTASRHAAGARAAQAGAAPAAARVSALAGQAAGQQHPSRRDVGGPRLSSHGIVVNYPSRHARRLPSVPASAFVIADAGTGQVLAARNAHGQFGPASTLKVLTAITMIPRLRPDALVVATRLAAETEPADVGLVAGRSYRVADLFRALLLISANDAAVALAQASGSFSHGIALMNAEAHHLQAYDVVARQPNGLPAPGQVVSAYDEALIARQALSMPAFMQYDSTVSARFPVTPRKVVTLVNQNSLLTHYRGGIGGKIGWTVRSEATYIGLARRNGVTLIVTLLHCTPLKEITSGERLLDWGFAMAGHLRPVGVLVPPLSTAADQHPAAGTGKADGHAPAAGTGKADGHGPAAAAGAATPAGKGDAAQLSGALPASGHGASRNLAIAAGLAAAAVMAVAAALSRRRSTVPGRHRSR